MMELLLIFEFGHLLTQLRIFLKVCISLLQLCKGLIFVDEFTLKVKVLVE